MVAIFLTEPLFIGSAACLVISTFCSPLLSALQKAASLGPQHETVCADDVL